VAQAPALLQVHHDRARRAGELLGAKSVSVLGFPDQYLDTVPLLKITQSLEREIERLEPDTIFTQHGGDLNLDHHLLYRATLTATRPMQGSSVKRVYAYEVASSTEWSFQKFEPRFQSSVFFNIQDTLENKIAAMAVYESEVRTFPHPRSPEALRAIAQRWGSVVGLAAAEAFELVREIHQ
jgi:LmbE family N-acetylglucosaminyl deacetylase